MEDRTPDPLSALTHYIAPRYPALLSFTQLPQRARR